MPVDMSIQPVTVFLQKPWISLFFLSSERLLFVNEEHNQILNLLYWFFINFSHLLLQVHLSLC